MPTLRQQLFRIKPVPRQKEDVETDLKRTIGLFSLTMVGVGSTIGTGIFFILSESVPVAGPAVIWSFVIAGAVAGLAVICYAELAGSVPVSGSSYSYAYATLGELPAMGVAACLLLEYGVAGAAVAVGWSQYVNQLLFNLFGFQIPHALAYAPEEGGIVNLPAILLLAMCCFLLVRGTGESIVVNAIMVCLKIGVLIFFICVGVTGWDSNNFADFAPFGISGVVAGSGLIFFSYVGMDAVATAGDETKNPKKTMPRALIAALIIVTSVYVLVAVAALSAQPWEKFDGQTAGLSAILENIVGSQWPGTVVAAGAVISIFSVTLVSIYGQSRILFTMAGDGMMPKLFREVNPRTLTPVKGTIVVSAVIAVLAGFIPLNFLAEMTSIGTLVAFVVVSLAVIILRVREPNLERGFKVPFYPVLPVLSIIGCFWIISSLQVITIVVFIIWTAFILGLYFIFGRKSSVLGKQLAEAGPANPESPGTDSTGGAK